MTLEKESGTSAPVFRRRNDLHWVALLEFVANSSVKQIRSGTNSVPRRENVCLMARESSALRNGSDVPYRAGYGTRWRELGG